MSKVSGLGSGLLNVLKGAEKQVENTATKAEQNVVKLGQKAAQTAGDVFETVASNVGSLKQTYVDLTQPEGPKNLVPPPTLGLNTTDAQLSQLLDQHTQSTLTTGNRVGVYVDGQNALPQILSSIDSAQKSICYETYEFDKSGTTVDEVVSHLIAAKQRGVDVRVSSDAIGGRDFLFSHNPELARIQAAGIPVQLYNPVNSLQDLDVHRDHRKSIIVDGQTAWVLGMNTGDRYLGDPSVPNRFHDVATQIQGPAVAPVLNDFINTWKTEGGSAIDPSSLMGPPAKAISTNQTNVSMRIIEHTPGQDENIRAAYLALINHATTNVNLENAYPPADDIVNALCAAAKRGVNVRYVYGSNEGALGMDARTQFDKLLQAGVHIYIYPTPIHTKSLSVDGTYATVGSSNVDNVALNRNQEIISLAQDPAYTQAFDQQLFDKDVVGTADGKKSVELKYPLNDSLWQKLSDAVLAKLWPDSYE
ncbi:MAG: phosphatidylserine/phosphatidylglycerophosphate/cardiolipin synthase family protein [Deltaproteobacteria bacterium]|nr:phosphatidylserine/phosphatidylglycerophosphate/cardiolipin synthase family protein [Deltaproteobacteria bacterium]